MAEVLTMKQLKLVPDPKTIKNVEYRKQVERYLARDAEQRRVKNTPTIRLIKAEQKAKDNIRRIERKAGVKSALEHKAYREKKARLKARVDAEYNAKRENRIMTIKFIGFGYLIMSIISAMFS